MNSERFLRAFQYAAHLHANQPRKGTSIPYISHLMIVAGTVIEHGGDEDQAIAALLHDAIEDHPADGRTRLEILREFGPRVLQLVEACSDSETLPKPPWRERKERYLEHLRHTTPEARLISLCDKLHNARAILADHRQVGEEVWERFTATREETLWYYRSLADTFKGVQPGFLADELNRTVTALEEVATRAHESSWGTIRPSYTIPAHRLRLVRDHPVVELADGLALIDTGSPLTLGIGRPLEIEGTRRDVAPDSTGVLRDVSRWLGVEVDWLIGNDVVATEGVTLDWPAGTIEFGVHPGSSEGTEIPFDLIYGVPWVEGRVDGRAVRTILDSGAHLSYADPDFVRGRPAVGTVEDFYPSVGAFETQVYEFPISVGGREITGRWGVLPEKLGLLTRTTGAQWILGIDFFRDRRIILDYSKGRVIDST